MNDNAATPRSAQLPGEGRLVGRRTGTGGTTAGNGITYEVCVAPAAS